MELLPQALVNLGESLRAQGRLREAVASFQRATELAPHYADAWRALADARSVQKNFQLASQAYVKALELRRDDPASLCGLGRAYEKLDRFDEALGCYRTALAICPLRAEIHFNLGAVAHRAGRLDDAIAAYRQAVALKPDYANAHVQLAAVLGDLDRVDEALEHSAHALRLLPNQAAAQNNHGTLLQERGDIAGAMTHYRRAIEIAPLDPEAHINYATTLLLCGNFAHGWPQYEWRWQARGVTYHPHRRLPLRIWDGTPLAARTLLVHGEQGVGDEIMFASCIADLLERGERCVIDCDVRLAPLFARSFPGAVVSGTRGESDLSDLAARWRPDVQIPAGTLPRYLRLHLAGFPRRPSYLVPDPQLVRVWSERYRRLGRGLVVGISWRGGGNAAEHRRRSTRLEQWRNLFAVPAVHFVNLQYGDCANEVAAVHDSYGVTIHTWPDVNPLQNLDGFAAQVAALDLVISVTNATVHMAGGVGIPTWVLLNPISSWRWLLDREDSPWYPSVRLFRQSQLRHWDDVFARVARELGVAAAARSVQCHRRRDAILCEQAP